MTSPTAWPARPHDEQKKAQRPLLYRATDDFVRHEGLANPLSVSSDRIAYCAMRSARILAEVADRCGPEAVERDGGHLVCEVYPAPALRHWTQSSAAALAPRESYKGPAVEKVARRVDLLKTIVAQLQLSLDPPFRRTVRLSDLPSRA
ncbi:DUF429 domain-containing protein [Paraconexibacter antarcticus]|uniref:DUF429 domain-containing protein n=1 Tax=Paraconexibacter antarcticus TaxID=2949664 RepID=UPI0034613165